jgi:hypothetical protein
MRTLAFALGLTSMAGCYASAPPTNGDAASAIDAANDVGVDAAMTQACGTFTCGAGEICISGRCAGCCDVPPSCIPIPTGCSGALACGCFTSDPCGGCTHCGSVDATGIHCVNCMCTCAAAWTPIDTPDGPRRIDELRVGDRVLSLDHGLARVVPIVRVRRQPVEHHALVRVTLTSGEIVEMSASHPTADQRRFDALVPGDHLGDAVVRTIETVPYDEPATYDILPASETGTYRVHGAWIGSTLWSPTIDATK